MKTRTLTQRLVIAALLLVIPATAALAATRGEAEQAIAEAKAMREKAIAAGVTESEAQAMIEEAEGLLPSRQYTRAQMIAYWAIRQDEFAMRLKSGTEPAEELSKAELAKQAIAAAEEAQKRAAAVGGEWRDVGEMIKNAKTLAGAGELDQAIEVASAAQFQSERGYEQAMEERDAGFPDYMLKAVGK